MLLDMNVPAGSYGAPPILYQPAAGVIAELADRLRKSPWLSYLGARVEWDVSKEERSIEITRERWEYIRHRAAGEIPDLGGAENLAELLWSDGLPAELAPAIGPRGPMGRIDIRIRSGDKEWGCREHIDATDRNVDEVMWAYHRVIGGAARACPPAIEDWPAAPGENERRHYEGKPPITGARCVGCGKVTTFTGQWTGEMPPPEYIRGVMVREHPLCGIRHADTIERELAMRGRQRPEARVSFRPLPGATMWRP